MGSYLESSRSADRTLQVAAYALAAYLGSTITPRVRAGKTYSVVPKLRNDGEAGYLWVQLRDYDYGTLLNSKSENYAIGETRETAAMTGAMPTRDLTCYVRGGHFEAGVAVEDFSSNPFTIELSIETALTLQISPSQVAPGGTVNWLARLTQVDNGAPLAGYTVNLYGVGSEITDSNGEAGGSFIAPSAPGTYTYYAWFSGISTGAYYEAAKSKEIPVYVGVTPTWWDQLVAMWNALPWWKKALVVVGGIGSVGGVVYVVTKK